MAAPYDDFRVWLEASEFLFMSDSEITISGEGFLSGRVVSQVDMNPIQARLCLPVSVAFRPRNTFKTRSIFGHLFSIGLVLGLGAGPEIQAAIIECILVLMIGIYALLICQRTVHKDHPSVGYDTFKASCVEPILCSESVPIPLHEPFVVGSIYNGNLSFGESDKSDRLVGRLDNGFAGNAILRHGLTSNEIVRSTAPLHCIAGVK